MITRFTLLLLVTVGTVQSKAPVVTVTQGTLEGVVLTALRGKLFFAFYGIPYAKPPIRELRFKAPRPPEPWDGIRNAEKPGYICPQENFFNLSSEGDEDCLFLNVFTSKLPDDGDEVKKDVMVYIHGGGFLGGSGNGDLSGPEKLMDADIVLITFNYRLGALGFLSTEDAASPGNYGLKDQVQALKWVQQNIAAFGGNPDSVTIFGISAGGGSVHHQLLSPMTKGLFHGAIAQSGNALCPWGVAEDPRGKAFKLGRLVGCQTQDSEELINCLRRTDVRDFIKATNELKTWDNQPLIMAFLPAVEKEVEQGEPIFLPKHPEDIIRSGEFQKVPWITGVTSHEGMMFAAMFFINPKTVADLRDEFDRVMPLYYQYQGDPETTKQISHRLKDFYFGGKSPSEELWDQFAEMESDFQFFVPAYRAAKLHLQAGSPPLYFYQFSYRGNHTSVEMLGIKDKPGVCHGDDGAYLFTSTIFGFNIQPDEPDMAMVDTLITMWTNFAKTRQTWQGERANHTSLGPQNSGLKLQCLRQYVHARRKACRSEHRTLEVVNFCLKNDIELLCLSPHCTHV